jgi:hypothetical protein
VGPDSSKEDLKEKNKSKKKKVKIREYDPEKDKACLIIGGYSTYIKKKEVTA